MALNFIGSRGARQGVTREKRIKYAREILQKEMLPHIGISDFCETRKAYFLGWVNGWMGGRVSGGWVGGCPEDGWVSGGWVGAWGMRGWMGGCLSVWEMGGWVDGCLRDGWDAL